MSDYALQSQEFAAQQGARGAGYQMQATGGIPEIGQSYLQARHAADQHVVAQAEINFEELRRQELQQKVQAVAGLQALGSQQIQMEQQRQQLALQRIQVQKAAQEANPNFISTRDYVHYFAGRPMTMAGEDGMQTYYRNDRGDFQSRAATPQETKEYQDYLARNHANADPIKLRQDAIIARMRILNSRADRMGRRKPEDLDEINRLMGELDALHKAHETGVVPPPTPEGVAAPETSPPPAAAANPSAPPPAPPAPVTAAAPAQPPAQRPSSGLALPDQVTPQWSSAISDQLGGLGKTSPALGRMLGEPGALGETYLKKEVWALMKAQGLDAKQATAKIAQALQSSPETYARALLAAGWFDDDVQERVAKVFPGSHVDVAALRSRQ